MDDDVKIVIRGVLDKIEDENLTEDKGKLICSALDRLCGDLWNVVFYPTYESEKGYCSSYFHWRSKYWVYAEKSISTNYNSDEIKKFMNTEFGWAKIKDIDTVQQAAYTKINNKFPGVWRVHVAKLNQGYSSYTYGTAWKSDEFTFFIYRIA